MWAKVMADPQASPAEIYAMIKANSLAFNSRQGFGGGRSNRAANGNGQVSRTGSAISSPTALSAPGLNSSYGASPHDSGPVDFVQAEPPKYFFLERYAKLGVKGNFMPLAAQPKYVDLADWLAHQGNDYMAVL
jgi:hypothetical protein